VAAEINEPRYAAINRAEVRRYRGREQTDRKRIKIASGRHLRVKYTSAFLPRSRQTRMRQREIREVNATTRE